MVYSKRSANHNLQMTAGWGTPFCYHIFVFSNFPNFYSFLANYTDYIMNLIFFYKVVLKIEMSCF